MSQLICQVCERGGLQWRNPEADDLLDTPMFCTECGFEYPNMQTFIDFMMKPLARDHWTDDHILWPSEPGNPYIVFDEAGLEYGQYSTYAEARLALETYAGFLEYAGR